MPGYLVKHEHIAIAGVDSLHIRSLRDRQQFSDPLGQAAALGISSAAWPLFGLLWPSGLQLAALMALRPLPYCHGRWGAGPGEEAPSQPLAPLPAGRFDLIIGSDLLYERDERGDLAAYIVRYASPQAQVLIIDPDRGNRPAFNRRMASAGFALTETRLPAAPAAGPAYKGRLLSYARAA